MPVLGSIAYYSILLTLFVLVPTKATSTENPIVNQHSTARKPNEAHRSVTARTGMPAGESLNGQLERFRILRKELTIDFRALSHELPFQVDTDRAPDSASDSGLVQISSAYYFNNEGIGRPVDLVIITPALSTLGSGVWLDGHSMINIGIQPAQMLPGAGRTPATTPLPSGDSGALPYRMHDLKALGLSIFLPPGPHRLLVRYRAAPSTASYRSSTAYWQLAYLLAMHPARVQSVAWNDSLIATILLPNGWEAAASPPMHRLNDSLIVGAWSGMPGEGLTFTLHAPSPPIWDARLYPWLGLVALLALTSLFGSWFGARAAHYRYGKRRALVLAPICALACAICFFWLYVWSGTLPELRAGIQSAWPIMRSEQTARGMSRGSLFVLTGMAGVLLTWVASLALFFRSYKLAKQKTEREPQRSDAIGFKL